jgi:hypothetical protein
VWIILYYVHALFSVNPVTLVHGPGLFGFGTTFFESHTVTISIKHEIYLNIEYGNVSDVGTGIGYYYDHQQ